jgi:hypothetical protein
MSLLLSDVQLYVIIWLLEKNTGFQTELFGAQRLWQQMRWSGIRKGEAYVTRFWTSHTHFSQNSALAQPSQG